MVRYERRTKGQFALACRYYTGSVTGEECARALFSIASAACRAAFSDFVDLCGELGPSMFFIGMAIPAGIHWITTNAFYRPGKWQRNGAIYEKLGIKKWKDRVPDMSKFVTRMYRKKRSGVPKQGTYPSAHCGNLLRRVDSRAFHAAQPDFYGARSRKGGHCGDGVACAGQCPVRDHSAVQPPPVCCRFWNALSKRRRVPLELRAPLRRAKPRKKRRGTVMNIWIAVLSAITLAYGAYYVIIGILGAACASGG